MKTLIPISKPSISDLEKVYIADAINSGWVSSLGPYIERFEQQFAEFVGTKHALTVCNATAGLHLALLAVGILPDDEVIIPDFSFVATANAVRHAGAKPIFVDIDPESLCLDSRALKGALTRRTKAIIPVHVYGHPADMDGINSFASNYGLAVIEDAAEAHGARYRGRAVGSLGACGVFSFYGNKIMTAGEGGMITTDDPSLYSRAKHLRDHAMTTSKRYWHDEVGYNYRMTNLQAALGLAQLERIEDFITCRRKIMDWYREDLGDVATLRLNRRFGDVECAYWMYCIEIDGLTPQHRDNFMLALKDRGIDSRPYFYPISDMPMYDRANTPITHKLSQIGLNIPSFVDLSRDNVAYISHEIKSLVESGSYRSP